MHPNITKFCVYIDWLDSGSFLHYMLTILSITSCFSRNFPHGTSFISKWQGVSVTILSCCVNSSRICSMITSSHRKLCTGGKVCYVWLSCLLLLCMRYCCYWAGSWPYYFSYISAMIWCTSSTSACPNFCDCCGLGNAECAIRVLGWKCVWWVLLYFYFNNQLLG